MRPHRATARRGKASGIGRNTIRRLSSLTAAVAVVVGGVTLAAADPATAVGAGRVCMFNATEGAWIAGHVGWAFRVGGADDWIYGATEDPSHNWQKESNWKTMLDTFRAQGGKGYYDTYRCRNTGHSSVTAAKDEVKSAYSRPYDAGTDNCLTRSVEFFLAYDSDLWNDLPLSSYTGPNWYYDNDLGGFEGKVNL
ncbi:MULTISPECIES: hypothetical protein [unclassified Streptomyces]|uniref:hypothetical protein n=1 Tax=unclassified Streptomyces TaxID=2593676 RepID=UPI00225130A2|nr:MULTISPECIES: hypothetical protein [unclassified Streptomyces]MCX5063879.1 hypothetical protein [Streptomyces sp. NBC_00452]